jgi:hypothetical protein
MGQQFPQLMQFAGDLIFKSMDLPYAEDIAERLKTMLPPEIQQIIDKDKTIPPEVMQMMAQAQQAMQQVEQHGQLVEAASAELEKEQSLNEKQKAEIRTELANVDKAKAQMETQLAKAMLQLVQKEAGIAAKEAQLQGSEDAIQKVGKLDEILASFMLAVDQAMTGLEEKAAGLQKTVGRKPIGGKTRRENGRLVADVEYDDGTTRSISAVREQGNLRIVTPDPEA